MKRLFGLLMLIHAGCTPQAEGEPVTRIDLENPGKDAAPETAPTPTPTVASACATVTFDGSQFTRCTADPAKHRISTMLGNPP